MWIIGDIHGCFDELDQLLLAIPEEDHLLFIGDYVDRGPESYRVVERLLQEQDRSIFLQGNHESMMMAHFQHPDSPAGSAWTYPGNGGTQTLSSYKLNLSSPYDDIPPKHRAFFEGLLLYFETEDFIAVHAGLRPEQGTSLKSQDPEDLLWIREEWIREESSWEGKRVYYGHTPARYVLGMERQDEPIVGEKSIGIDTGCVYGGSLTAINSETNELIQIKASKEYV